MSRQHDPQPIVPPHPERGPAQMFVVSCSCGFKHDSSAATDVEAVAWGAKTHVHPGAAITARPVDYSGHPLYQRDTS